MPAIPLTEPQPGPACDTSTTNDLRSVLRNATAPAHARLDALFGQSDLQTLSGYRGFLEAHAIAVLPLEADLVRSGVEQLFVDWPSRSRSRALSADLISLGGRIRALATLPRLDVEGVLGTMYVLEGSRLGARFLLRRVQQSADPAVARTTAYLSHGAGSQLWPSFLATLERHAAEIGDPAGVVAAARWTFGVFERAAADLAAAPATQP